MLVTITDLEAVSGKELMAWRKASHALSLDHERMILCMSPQGAQAAFDLPVGPNGPVAREPTLPELRAWFDWQSECGRTNQRFVEGGLPWPADDQ